MIEQFRTFDSLLPDTVSVSSITADVDGEDTVLSYNFTIVGSYRDMDEAPEDEMTDEEAMQQNLEDTENHEVAKAHDEGIKERYLFNHWIFGSPRFPLCIPVGLSADHGKGGCLKGREPFSGNRNCRSAKQDG